VTGPGSRRAGGGTWRRGCRRRWARFASGARAAKYRHLLDENPGLSVAEQALLAVLMLRGPQTPGELRQRVERMHPFEPAALDGLVERGFVARLGRRPGQKEERYAHRLSEDLEEGAPAAAPAPAASIPAPAPARDDDRLGRLERELAALSAQVRELRDALGMES